MNDDLLVTVRAALTGDKWGADLPDRNTTIVWLRALLDRCTEAELTLRTIRSMATDDQQRSKVPTDEAIAARILELRDRCEQAEALAYLGEHHFPDLTWKARCEDLVAENRALCAATRELGADLNDAEYIGGNAQTVALRLVKQRDEARAEADARQQRYNEVVEQRDEARHKLTALRERHAEEHRRFIDAEAARVVEVETAYVAGCHDGQKNPTEFVSNLYKKWRIVRKGVTP